MAARHEPGGQVHRVAHHRVRAAVRRADVAGEHRAPVHADADPERDALLGDLADRAAASAPRRRPGVGYSRPTRMILPPSRVDVGAEEQTPCSSAASLLSVDEPVQLVGDRDVRPLARERSSVPSKWRNATVACGAPGSAPPEELIAQSRPGPPGTVRIVAVRSSGEHRRPDAADLPRRSEAGARRAPTAGRAGVAPRSPALTTISPASCRSPCDRARSGSGHEQLAMGLADQEEVERAGVDARPTSGGSPCRPRRSSPRSADLAAPASRWRPASRLLVLGAGEQQQQRVAAELQQLAVLAVRDTEQRPKHVVDRVGDLFGADPPSRASRSDSSVKPEMSTNTTVPSIENQSGSVKSVRRSSRTAEKYGSTDPAERGTPSIALRNLVAVGRPQDPGRTRAVAPRAVQRTIRRS